MPEEDNMRRRRDIPAGEDESVRHDPARPEHERAARDGRRMADLFAVSGE